ncbi:MAG TPA: WYL domain-containing protein, partial [Rugosimonospora sp.]|nr:WYL domain-containing protein [Rugosimonospora sp.]
TQGLARVPYAWEIEVLLDTDLASARARIPASVGLLAEAPGGVLLRARAERLDGAAPMLAGLGFGFTIVRPDELRPILTAYATRLATDATRQPRQPGGWQAEGRPGG